MNDSDFREASDADRRQPEDPESESADRPRPSEGGAAAWGMVTSLERLDRIVARFAETATAGACIGEPQSGEGHTVIPLAAVSLQLGFGMGFGGGGGDGGSAGSGSGGGGGGGGRSVSRVIAVVDISQAGARVRPVLDFNAIIRAVLAISLGRLLLSAGRRGAARLLGRSAGSP